MDESEFTTLILRNIPTRYSTAWLIEEIQATGNRCNFVHMPMAPKIDINLGYAFINFVTAEEAKAFLENYRGQRFAKQPRSNKRASIDYASLQGFQQNVDFYKGRRIAKTKYAPWVLREE
jgi:RNA recognition motif-containing protein